MSVLEQIRVRSSTGQFKVERIILDLLDQKLVGADVAFTMANPAVGECMVELMKAA